MRLLIIVLLLFNQQLFAQTIPALIPYVEKGLWGYCDSNMQIIIPCQYSDAYPFYDDRALVFKNYPTAVEGEFLTIASFINSKGEEIFRLPPNYYGGFVCTRFQRGVAIVQNYQQGDNMEGSPSLSVIDVNGRVLQHIDSCILHRQSSMFHLYSPPFDTNGLYFAEATTSSTSPLSLVMIFEDRRPPIYTHYRYISAFTEGIAVAINGEPNWETGISSHCLINKKGECLAGSENKIFVIEYESESNTPPISNGLIGMQSGEKYGYVNTKCEWVIEPQFDLIFPFSEGLAAVGKIVDIDSSNGYPEVYYQFGYINAKGELQIPYQFSRAFAFREGFAQVQKKDEGYFINPYGIIQFKQNMKGFYDAYSYPRGFCNGVAIVSRPTGFGWIDQKGNFLIPPFYGGMFRIGPSIVVETLTDGLVRVSSESGSSFEFYVDIHGQAYRGAPAPCFLISKKPLLLYSTPHLSFLADSINDQDMWTYSEFTGQKKKEPKGRWIETNNWNGEIRYVPRSAVNTNCLMTTARFGAPVHESPNMNARQLNLLKPFDIVFLADGENPKKVGKDVWVKVIFISFVEKLGMTQQTGYIRGNTLKWLK